MLSAGLRSAEFFKTGLMQSFQTAEIGHIITAGLTKKFRIGVICRTTDASSTPIMVGHSLPGTLVLDDVSVSADFLARCRGDDLAAGN